MAMIEIRKGVFIKTFFWSFVEGQDALGVIFKDEEGWHFRFRFRYYNPKSADPFDGMDDKKEYGIMFKEEDLDRVCEIAEEMFVKGTQAFGEDAQVIKADIDKWGDDPTVIEALQKLPFMHCREFNDA